MKRLFVLVLAAAALSLTGCLGYYVPKAGTDAATLQTNVDQAEARKQERLK